MLLETTYHIDSCPASFALLADTHNKPYQDVLGALERRSPDFIAIAGDVVRRRYPRQELIVKEQEQILPLLRACVQLAPTYLSWGNHELYLCADDIALIADTGVTILDNTWAETSGILLGGLTSGQVLSYRAFRENGDVAERYPHRAKGMRALARRVNTLMRTSASMAVFPPDTSWLDEYACMPGFHVLLCHHPEYLPLIPPGVELVCAGHAHGGQWRYHSFRTGKAEGVFAPGQGLFPRYTRGMYDGRMIVSAGLANTAPVPRFGNPRELIFVEPA